MKYTMYGFNQEVAVKLGLSSDDLAILRWFIDFKDSGTMEQIFNESEGRMYYWVTYKKIIEDIPIVVVDCKVNDDLGKQYKKSKEQRLYDCRRQKLKRVFQGNLSKVIFRQVEKNSNGTMLFIAINEEIYKLLVEENQESNINKNTDNNAKKGDEVINGQISVDDFDLRGRSKITKGVDEISPKGLVNFDQTNINLLNNKSISNSYKYIYCSVIEYLNKKTASKYKANTKKTCDLIKARINEGFSEEDFIKVIDNKCDHWLNTEYEQYLRPETLFGTKFESYLNQKVGRGNSYGGTRKNISTGKSSIYDFSKINDM